MSQAQRLRRRRRRGETTSGGRSVGIYFGAFVIRIFQTAVFRRGSSRPLQIKVAVFATVFAVSIVCAPRMPAQQRYSAPPIRAAAATAGSRAPALISRFQARVAAILKQSPSERAYWGIFIVDRDTGKVLYDLNADHFFTPASNAKVFTTAFALATLGTDYRFRTTLESNGTMDARGRLDGNLILVGRGDPDLSNRKFPASGNPEHDGPVEKVLSELVDAAVAKGLRAVHGDIVADDSFLPYDPYPAGWTDGDLFFTFGAPVSAIAFNDNSFAIEVRPGAAPGDPAVLAVDPPAAADTFGREIVTVEASKEPDIAVVRQASPDFILVRGSIPVGHAPLRIDLAMTQPAETAARTLRQLLESRGVQVGGQVSVQHAPPPITTAAGDPVIPPNFSPLPRPNPLVLAEHLSPPLIESVRATNKLSLNLHAELFLRTAAREKTGLGSTAMGLQLERDFLRKAGIADGAVVLSDGSGLARDDLATPRAMVELLRYAFNQPWGSQFVSTLPVAGVDGTLDNRLKGPRVDGLIRAKTGSLEGVHSISGYATTARGEDIAFAVFENNDPQHGRDATAAIDAICEAMVETLGPPSARRKK